MPREKEGVIAPLGHDPEDPSPPSKPPHRVEDVRALVQEVAVAAPPEELQGAKRPAIDRRLHGQELLAEAKLMAYDQEDAACLTGLQHALALGQGPRHRLFRHDGTHAWAAGGLFNQFRTGWGRRGKNEDLRPGGLKEVIDGRIPIGAEQARRTIQHLSRAIGQTNQPHAIDASECPGVLDPAGTAPDNRRSKHHASLSCYGPPKNACSEDGAFPP
jgi:hypothetical protein